jgi:hypothetical protein
MTLQEEYEAVLCKDDINFLAPISARVNYSTN